jgi:hypothetical protein
MEKHPWIKGPTFSSRDQKGTAGEHPKEEIYQKRKKRGVLKNLVRNLGNHEHQSGSIICQRGPRREPKI